MKSLITAVLDAWPLLLAAGAGGLIDWINQVHKGSKKRTLGGLLIHLLSALFFGWAAGRLASGIGYPTDIVYAASGIGGYFGVRVADLITYYALGPRRSTDEKNSK